MKQNSLMKPKPRRLRCKQVLAILLSRLETLELIREEEHPPIGDFASEALELAVVRWNGLEVYLPLDCVVFLSEQPYAERSKDWGLKFLKTTGC
jgi:hypothetical protein